MEIKPQTSRYIAMDYGCDTKLCFAACVVDPPLEGQPSSASRRYGKLLPFMSHGDFDLRRDREYQFILLHQDNFRRNSNEDATAPVVPELRVKNAKFSFQLDAVKRDLIKCILEWLKANENLEINLHPLHCMSQKYLKQVRGDDTLIARPDANDCWYARGFLITYQQKIPTDDIVAAGAENSRIGSNVGALHSSTNESTRPRQFFDQVDEVSGKHDFRIVLELRQTACKERVGVGQTFRQTTNQPETDAVGSRNADDQQREVDDCSSQLLLQFVEMTADQLLSEITTCSSSSSSSCSCSVPLDVLSPEFVDRRNNSVFHSLMEVRRVLVEAQEAYDGDVKPFTELLQLLDSTGGGSEQAKGTGSLDFDQLTSRTCPFIVVEGLDGTGKSTVASSLAKELRGCQLYSPPESMKHLRGFFDDMPSIVRRAFYSLGNYLVDQTARNLVGEKPIVLDRYWHSTAAYAIAEETSIPDRDDHWIYRWPEDLFRPTIAILLVVNEQVRAERIERREVTDGITLTNEEIALRDKNDLKTRILKSYRRMHNPAMIEVSAEGTPDQVLQRVTDVLRLNNVL